MNAMPPSRCSLHTAGALLAVSLASLFPAQLYAQCDVPPQSLVSGGIGKDAIPALTNPEVVEALPGDAHWRPADRVLGVVMNGVARAYPIPILWWHEIVNDVLGDVPIAVTYCPLTGSGIVFDPTLDGVTVMFGTSGLLLDNNLVMYDRGRAETLWSQMGFEGVCGARDGAMLRLYPVVETTWAAWKHRYPETTVLTRNTGHRRNYDRYPYGDYDQLDNEQLLFPQSLIDERLPMKAMVHGIAHDGAARAYSLDSLAVLGDRVAYNDEVNLRPVVIVYDRASGSAISFDRRTRVLKKNGKLKRRTFEFDVVDDIKDVDGTSSFLLRDRRSGTLFDLTGKPVAGKWVDRVENGGLQQVPQAYTAFWFAWATFHRGTDLF